MIIMLVKVIKLVMDGGFEITVRANDDEFRLFERAMSATSGIGGDDSFPTVGLITMHCGDCSRDSWDKEMSEINVNCKKVMIYRVMNELEI